MWQFLAPLLIQTALQQALGVRNGAKVYGYLAPIIADIQAGTPLPPVPQTPATELEVSFVAPLVLWGLHHLLGTKRGDLAYAYVGPIVANVLADTNPFPPVQTPPMGDSAV